MNGPLVISEEDASHARACAEYLAELAHKWARLNPADGDEQDVDNNLSDILKLFSGDRL